MGRTVLMVVVCAIATTAIAFQLQAQKKLAADLSGTWQIHFQDDNGASSSNPKLVIHQTSGKLTGTFGNQDWPITGAVDGTTVIFTFTAHGHENGKAISDTVFYWGSMDGPRMKGRMKNPKEAGDWAAVRK